MSDQSYDFRSVPPYRTGQSTANPSAEAVPARGRTKSIGYGTLNRRESVQLGEIWLDWSVLAEILKANREKVLAPRVHRATAQRPETPYYALRLVLFRSDDPNDTHFFKVSLDLDPKAELARREQYRAQLATGNTASSAGQANPTDTTAREEEEDPNNWDPFS